MTRPAGAGTRWPVVTTSVSGIPAPLWVAFKRQAAGAGHTHRLALQAAVLALARAVEAGVAVAWQPPQHSRPHSIRAHADVLAVLDGVIARTGYRRSIVVHTALTRWLEAAETQALEGNPS